MYVTFRDKNKANMLKFQDRLKNLNGRQTLDLAIEINNRIRRLERVKEISFLGVILDESLTWKSLIFRMLLVYQNNI